MAPYTVKARLLLKDIWRISGQKWDDILPEEIKKQFIEWHSGLQLLGSLTIPGSYFTDPFDRIEIHIELHSIKDIRRSPDQSSHVLGLKWDHVKDALVVSRATIQRTVLSFVSSVFDPIELVALYTVKARLLLKDIFRISGKKWDDDLPEEIKKQFLEWHSGLHLLSSLTIPRSYFTDAFDRIEFRMFGDSLLDVFCAVAFLRARLASSSQTQLAFVFGKARVTPMKALSIPKLELQAALLATRLKEETLKGLIFKVTDIFMWTDNTTVLQWPNPCSKLPVFVGNRTGEILESYTTDQWHHILSRDNPADTGTRGISSEALRESSWVNGPSILRTTDWPFKPDTMVIDINKTQGTFM